MAPTFPQLTFKSLRPPSKTAGTSNVWPGSFQNCPYVSQLRLQHFSYVITSLERMLHYIRRGFVNWNTKSWRRRKRTASNSVPPVVALYELWKNPKFLIVDGTRSECVRKKRRKMLKTTDETCSSKCADISGAFMDDSQTRVNNRVLTSFDEMYNQICFSFWVQNFCQKL